MPRIYLDNAATSWPKPETVYRAVDDYQRRLGAPAGRGAYAEVSETERLITSCRKKLARLIGAADPNRIVFTCNGTDSLNLALHGLLKAGDHVVTTVCEHNSVLRPLRHLAQQRDVSATYVGCDGAGYVDPDEIRRAITPRTRLIALVHASNVTGAVQPVEAVGRMAAEHGLTYLVDAAQSLGYWPVDVKRIGCHLLAAPGHKGLMGPLGTGLLYIAPDIEEKLLPLRQGGTGTRSGEDVQPTSLPDRYESGNLNVPGIVGLEAGVGHVLADRLKTSGVAGVERSEPPATGVELRSPPATPLMGQLLHGLTQTRGIALFGPRDISRRVGVVSLNVAGYDPQELASLLDANWSIQGRAGLHCAPRMHQALGTAPSGTLRLSLGHFSTAAEVEAVLAALAEVAAG